VTVSWSGVSDPSASDDWIGAYSLDPGMHFTSTAPVKYLLASGNSTWKDGYGSVQFRLINMRAPFFFTFMRNGFNQPVVAQQTGKVAFANYDEPLQPHLATTGAPNTLALTWVSLNTKLPQVRWGTRTGQYPNVALAKTTTYARENMCGDVAISTGFREPGALHTAILGNLIPGQQYFYIFGDVFGYSSEYTFFGPPAVGPDQTLRLLAWGDMGTAYSDGAHDIIHTLEGPSLATTANALTYINETDLILHIGDISYARGFASDWEDFFDQIAPMAARVPYMVGTGNHERDFPGSGSVFNGTDSGGECGVPYNFRFPFCAKPASKPDRSDDVEWYSFDYGNAHFLLMSTEHDFFSSSPQYAFIKNDLASVDRTRTPWLIFLGHRPMYIDSDYDGVSGSDQTVARALRASVEPLLVEYGVDLGLWGHHHSYQRTCPVNNQTCAEHDPHDGPYVYRQRTDASRLPIHVVIGMAGQGLSQNLETQPPNWIEFVNDQVYGYSRLELNATTLHLQFFQNQDRKLLDEFFIFKE